MKGNDSVVGQMPRNRMALAGLLAVPILVLPELVPGGLRVPVVTGLAFAAAVAGVYFIRHCPYVRLTVAAFAGVVWLSWLLMPSSLRHLAGISVGIFVAGVIAAWARDRTRLMTAATIVCLLGIPLLLLGLAAAPLDNAKFIDTARERPVPFFPWLPQIRLGLPGLEQGGRVNPNALGGLALLVMPLGAGLLLAARCARPRPRAGLVIGAVTSLLGAAVLAMSLSRTAYVAALMTLLLVGLVWRRGRVWVLMACVAISGAVVGGALYWRSNAPARFEQAMTLAQARVDERAAIWYDGVDALMISPVYGVGINQFHSVFRSVGSYGSGRVPHAHNVWLQTALDLGVVGLGAYVALLACVFGLALGAIRRRGQPAAIAAGAATSLIAVHMFGLGDAIALGAKVGIFQWLAIGLILAAWAVARIPAGDSPPA
jgi:O-antigen ligase